VYGTDRQVGIEYSVPDPEPTPAATPAVDALPNTATYPANAIGEWVAIAIGALLLATFVWTDAAGGRRA
jgi:hypothetical protein